MQNTINTLTSLSNHFEPNIITTLGVLIVVTFLGSKLFQKVGIPQVVGFIVVGVALGTSGLNLVPLRLVDDLSFISQIALGLIGFDMGGTLGRAAPEVKNNLGLGLLSQAGVAIGLAVASHDRFFDLGPEGEKLGALIISVITATTFVVQIFGPIGVKFAISRAGEVGRARLELNGWASEGTPD